MIDRGAGPPPFLAGSGMTKTEAAPFVAVFDGGWPSLTRTCAPEGALSKLRLGGGAAGFHTFSVRKTPARSRFRAHTTG